MSINRLQNEDADPLIHTEEAADLEFWARFQSWTFCEKCAKLEPRKLLPAFRRRAPTPLHNTCKCSNGTYVIPDVDDVPLLLRNVTIEDQRVLSPFETTVGTMCECSMGIVRGPDHSAYPGAENWYNRRSVAWTIRQDEHSCSMFMTY